MKVWRAIIKERFLNKINMKVKIKKGTVFITESSDETGIVFLEQKSGKRYYVKKEVFVENVKNGRIIKEYDYAPVGLFEKRNFIHEVTGSSTSNHCSMVRLDEFSVTRLFSDSHYDNGFIIISASKANDLESEETATQENKVRAQELLSKLSSNGYWFIPVYGSYIENRGEENQKTSYEEAFIVPCYKNTWKILNFDKLFDGMISLGTIYNQEVILVKEPGGKFPYYYKPTEKQVADQFSGKAGIYDLIKAYFRQLRKKDSAKFIFKGAYVNPSVCSLFFEGYSRDARGEIFISRNW
jgi:hypothetical protein